MSSIQVRGTRSAGALSKQLATLKRAGEYLNCLPTTSVASLILKAVVLIFSNDGPPKVGYGRPRNVIRPPAAIDSYSTAPTN